MHEQISTIDKTIDKSFETRLLIAKNGAQILLVEKEFGPQSEKVKEIISYLFTHGSKINDIFQQNPSLVDEFASDPDTVVDKIRKQLGN